MKDNVEAPAEWLEARYGDQTGPGALSAEMKQYIQDRYWHALLDAQRWGVIDHLQEQIDRLEAANRKLQRQLDKQGDPNGTGKAVPAMGTSRLDGYR